MVRDGVNGLLFAPGSAQSLAHAVTRVARDPVLLDRLAAGARELGSGWSSSEDAVDAVVECVAGATRDFAPTSSWWSSWSSKVPRRRVSRSR
jgi:hypothetical protein